MRRALASRGEGGDVAESVKAIQGKAIQSKAIRGIIGDSKSSEETFSQGSFQPVEQGNDGTVMLDETDFLIHQAVSTNRLAHPGRMSISACDSELTYKQLDDLSTRLAQYLKYIGVKPITIVPLCFEKSMWAVAAMLGVLKSGCAFTPLDPTQAPDRRARIIQDIDVSIILTSSKCSQLLTKTSFRVLEVGLSYKSRVLQFSAYTFDACIFEIFSTLLFGGCVCIPSENDRLTNLEV